VSIIEPVHNIELRLATDAFRNGCLETLYAESDEPPLFFRRNILLCNYGSWLATQPESTSCRTVFRSSFRYRYYLLTSAARHAGVGLHDLLQRLCIKLLIFNPPKTATGLTLGCPRTHLRSATYQVRWRPNVSSHVLCFAEFLSHFPDHKAVHTNGSLLQGSARSASV
jgi:hypothetical protein